MTVELPRREKQLAFVYEIRSSSNNALIGRILLPASVQRFVGTPTSLWCALLLGLEHESSRLYRVLKI